MMVLVKLVGIVMVVFGAIFLVKPDTIKQYVDFWAEEKRIYSGAVIALLMGLVFLIAAAQCALPAIIIIVGIISLAKGVVILAGGKEKFLKRKKWLESKKPSFLRGLAIFTLALGVLIIYAI